MCVSVCLCVCVLQVLQHCSDAELQQHWQECATLAGIKFDWRDTVDPLAAAQAAAYALHYYEPQQVRSSQGGVRHTQTPTQHMWASCAAGLLGVGGLSGGSHACTLHWCVPYSPPGGRGPSHPQPTSHARCPMFWMLCATQVLSGPVLMTGPFDAGPIRWFLQQLTPASMNVFWSSRRHSGSTDSREPFYGAQYSAEPLPQTYLDAAAAYAAVDEPAAAAVTTQPPPQQQQQEQEMSIDVGRQEDGVAVAGQQKYGPLPGELFLPPANWAIPTDFALRHQDASAGGAAGGPGEVAPACVLQQPGLCVWHKLDTSFELPKVCGWSV